MTTFFDKKQDVISIELTPYGRHLLSLGRLKPAYYAFFDDDILYDAAAGGFTEDNTAIRTRIIEETPRLRPQRDIDSPGSTITQSENYLSVKKIRRPSTQQRVHFLTEPLGTSDAAKDEPPRFKTSFIQGKISGSVESTLTGSYYEKHIPQINCDVEYTMSVGNTANDPRVRGRLSSLNKSVSATKPDNTYIKIDEDQILVELLELNGFKFKDGLEVEVFMYDEVSGNETFKSLKFLPEQKTIVDDLMVDSTPVSVDPTPDYVEHYFNFLTDSEIPESDICDGLEDLKSKEIFIDAEVNCPDREAIDFDIYGTRVTDVEVCD